MGESIKSKYTPIYPHKYQGNSQIILYVVVVGKESFVNGVI